MDATHTTPPTAARRRLEAAGFLLARHLARPRRDAPPPSEAHLGRLRSVLRPADVLLVDGTSKISTAIKYLTQSTWSHAALFVGDAVDPDGQGHADWFVEADVLEGIRAVRLATLAAEHTRICRPFGLTPADASGVVGFAASHLGHAYDLLNVLDLARYLVPQPPVPARWRRRLIALGSGDPTRAICSTLIASAFQAVRFPILPDVDQIGGVPSEWTETCLHVRHHSLFTPRDFDVSSYFDVVKPSVAAGFDYRRLHWAVPPEAPVQHEQRLA